MSDLIHIDGAMGEGGGQVIRSSLSLAMLTRRPLLIDRIRENRKPPGLKRQHLTAVNAAARISGAAVSEITVGSRSLTFEPATVMPGEYHFRIDTAGSATLVLQTVLPPLLLADAPSRLVLEGGTHNEWAPPFDFLDRAYLPLVNRMGPKVTATIERHGFFPAGGGRFAVNIEPAPHLAGFDILERGEIRQQRVIALTSQLPEHIAQREVDTLLRQLDWPRSAGSPRAVESPGPGNVVMVEVESEHVTEVFTGFGRRGIRAEQVARNVGREVKAYLKSDVPVGEHLADQWLLLLGISAWPPHPAQRGGAFRTLPLSLHARTQIEVMQAFLGIDAAVVDDDAGCTVRISPPAASSER